MGRGRQKAKQTKVARKLKYQNYEPDLDALARELGSGDADPYADYADAAPKDTDGIDDAEDAYAKWAAGQN